MKYGLSDKQLQEITGIISSYPQIEHAFIFGSRAINTYKEASDIDIAIKGSEVDSNLAAKLKDYLEEDTYLPFFFDVVAYNSIQSEELKKHIRTKGKAIYSKELEGWKEDISGNYVDLISGYAFKSKDFVSSQLENTLPVIKIKNVANGNVSLDDVVYHEYFESLAKFKLSKGDVLIAMTGNHPQSQNQVVGDVSRYKLDYNSLLNQRVGKLIAKENADLSFLYYLYKNKETRDYLANQSSGSANQANISKTNILNLELNLPPLSEQKAIAEVLSSLDDKIDLLHRQNKTLEDMAQTLFRKWFIDEADEDWEEKPLDKIADYLNGLACQKYPPANEPDKLPVLKIKELKDGFTEHSDWATSEVDEKYIVEFGDVIFSWSGSLMLKIWNGQSCVLNQHLFKVTSEKYPKWFYYSWTKHHLGKFIAIANSKATTMGHIKRGDLSNSLVLVPARKELSKMNDMIAPMFEKILSNQLQINTLEKLRDTLLPKLLSGKIRISHKKTGLQ